MKINHYGLFLLDPDFYNIFFCFLEQVLNMVHIFQ